MAVKRQAFLDAAFELFTEKGIEAVSLESVAKKSGYGTATLYRHFSNKVSLVVELATKKWEEYIKSYDGAITREDKERKTGAECLERYLDSFLDLYRNRKAFLRFNYDLNSYLRKEKYHPEQMEPYLVVIRGMGELFHEWYTRGLRDGTLNGNISEKTMFSGSFHLMLAAVTRYAMGLVYIEEQGDAPEEELVMLKQMLLREYRSTEKQSGSS